MANQIFMRVNEVAEELGISIPFAYRIIRQMNEELVDIDEVQRNIATIEAELAEVQAQMAKYLMRLGL